MCGIAGIANFPEERSHAALKRMRRALLHRGPDDQGEHWLDGGSLGFGHQRLSIIDLSPAGRQPMTDGDRLTLTYNGEVYNYGRLRDELSLKGHSFHTRTDSEVILRSFKEWGTDCISHFDGMFAMAIYDKDSRSIFFARDRAGEKPLYYWHDGRKLLFASEIKALLASKEIDAACDIDAFVHYLTYGYAPNDGCMLHGVKKLPPGQALLFDLETGELRQWCYWQLPESRSPQICSVKEYADRLQQILWKSVKERLAADVPVGVLLSGGLDSSLIASAAAEAGARRIRTFTVSFPGGGSCDERDHARLIARHFDTDHNELSAQSADIDLLGQMARQFDEPVGDPSAIPTFLVSKEIKRDATVALGGDGGDELFGGYRHYSYLHYQTVIRRWLPNPIRELIANSAARWLPSGATARNQLIALKGDLADAFAASNVYFDSVSRRRLLSPSLKNGVTPICGAQERRRSAYDPCLSAIQNATRLDFGGYMSEDILVKV
ncbi:MAG: asparagine synthase (glutamine-hydrolyzing), partial [Pseudomonadales bacterium]